MILVTANRSQCFLFSASLAIFLCLFCIQVPLVSCAVEDSICTSCQLYIDANCLRCLATYFRTYNLTTTKYDCVPGFLESAPPQQYCCHPSCIDCGTQGCMNCTPKKTLVFDIATQLKVCKCSQNYIQTSDGKCVCPVSSENSLYYEIVNQNGTDSSCVKCPEGCSCSSSGCVECDSETNRRIIRNYLPGRSRCPCNGTFFDYRGSCLLKNTCQPPDSASSTGSCEAGSHFVYSRLQSAWVCVHPYEEVNGTCQLKSHYVENNGVAKCLSESMPDKYYWFQNQCLVCPDNCTCTEQGCVSCRPGIMQSFVDYCFCSTNYSKVNDSQCFCLHPYVLNSSGNCVCRSELTPNAYILSINEKCQECPVGCTCTSFGCISCTPQSYRYIESWQNYSYCDCIEGSALVDGQCVCFGAVTVSQDNSPVCTGCPAQMYFNTLSSLCEKCPWGCLCSQNECLSCNQSSYAQNYTVNPKQPSPLSACRCLSGRELNVEGKCVCAINMIEYSNGSCICQQGFKLQGESCVCDSSQGKYYYDAFRQVCSPCPVGCLCNSSGCVSCISDTGRQVQQWIFSQLYICECQKGKRTAGPGFCSSCPEKSYFLNGKCIECPRNCKQCNASGCSQCYQNSTLDANRQCICASSDKENLGQNICVCPLGYYYTPNLGLYAPKNVSTNCSKCPYFCKTCAGESQLGLVFCLVCNEQNNRVARPDLNCPCKTGYHQTLENLEYCCPLNCLTCDTNGCLSCSPILNRQLNQTNRRCECLPGFQAVGDDFSACTCPPSQYSYHSECHPCPSKCGKCMADAKLGGITIICLTCKEGVNRNISKDCNCAQGYTESDDGTFCYPKYCTAQSIICDQCSQSRVYNKTINQCLCPAGFFDDGYTCSKCQTGCVLCSNSQSCDTCNSSGDYMLFMKKCTLIIRNKQLTISTSADTVSLLLASSTPAPLKTVKAFFVTTQNNNQSVQIIEANVTNIWDNKEFFKILMKAPQVQLKNYILHLIFVFYNISISAQSISKSNVIPLVVDPNSYIFPISIPIDTLYSQQQLSQFEYLFGLSIFICLLFLAVNAAIYIKGFRPNISVFYLQTLALLAFSLPDPSLQITPFLFLLRPVWFLFDFQAADRLGLLRLYQEKVDGNSRIFCIDSNILRLGFYLLILAGLCALTKLACYLIFKRLLPDSKTSSELYRIKMDVSYGLTFAERTLRYPLLYLSFLNLSNSVRGVQYIGSKQIHAVSVVISALVIVLYVILITHQVVDPNRSKVKRKQSLNQFCGELLVSVALGLETATSKYTCILVAILMLAKNIFSIWLHHFEIEEFEPRAVDLYLVLALVASSASLVVLAFDVSLMSFLILLCASCYLLLMSTSWMVVEIMNSHKRMISLSSDLKQQVDDHVTELKMSTLYSTIETIKKDSDLRTSEQQPINSSQSLR